MLNVIEQVTLIEPRVYVCYGSYLNPKDIAQDCFRHNLQQTDRRIANLRLYQKSLWFSTYILYRRY